MTIEYQLQVIPGLAPDEIGYLINGVQCAAVRLMRAAGAAASMFAVTASAFALEADGTPTLTATGAVIEDWHTASCAKADLLVDGVLSPAKVEQIKTQAIEQALTEMMGLIAAEAAFTDMGV